MTGTARKKVSGRGHPDWPESATLDDHIDGFIFYATRPIGEVIGLGLSGLESLALANREAEFLDLATLVDILQVINERHPKFIKMHYPEVEIPVGPQRPEDPHLRDD